MHQNPELSFKEFQTTEAIEKELSKQNIPFSRLAETGTIAQIGNNKSLKSIALRADIDALPIQEKTTISCKSTVEGIMHACGHDIHSSCLLGALFILKEIGIEELGNVRGIFQAGEELLPGGASILIKKGVLKGIDAIIGQHVMPEMPTGTFGFRPGKYMASTDELHITIHGKGGHGAMPETCIDPIAIGSQIVSGLQQIISRNAPSTIPSVLTIGKFIGDGATNVIPSQVKLEGTFRTLNEEWRKKAHVLIKNYITESCRAMGATSEVDIRIGYPFLENNVELTTNVTNWAKETNNTIEALDIRLTAEDFSFYSQEIPACFYRLGVGFIGETNHGVHHPEFNANEESILHGSAMMAWLAYKFLSK